MPWASRMNGVPMLSSPARRKPRLSWPWGETIIFAHRIEEGVRDLVRELQEFAPAVTTFGSDEGHSGYIVTRIRGQWVQGAFPFVVLRITNRRLRKVVAERIRAGGLECHAGCNAERKQVASDPRLLTVTATGPYSRLELGRDPISRSLAEGGRRDRLKRLRDRLPRALRAASLTREWREEASKRRLARCPIFVNTTTERQVGEFAGSLRKGLVDTGGKVRCFNPDGTPFPNSQ